MAAKKNKRLIEDTDERPGSEGMPDAVQDFPPGKDIETSEEAVMLPRDDSVAAGADPAYPVTQAEQDRLESLLARAARENPDIAIPPRDWAPLLIEDDGEIVPAEETGPPTAPEEPALHVERER